MTAPAPFVVTTPAVRTWVEHYLRRYGFDPSWWQFVVWVHDTPADETIEGRRDCEAYVDVRSGYFTFALTVHAYAVPSEQYLRATIAHEMGHVAADDVAVCVRRSVKDEALASRIVEQLVERMSRAVIAAEGLDWRNPSGTGRAAGDAGDAESD